MFGIHKIKINLRDEMMNSNINPSYYILPNGIEVWQVVGHLSKLPGDAVTYVLRAGHKGSEVEDIEKAIKSLQLYLEYIKLVATKKEEK